MSEDERVSAEEENLRAILLAYGVSENRHRALEPIIENVAWMKVKLDDTRAAIKHSSVVIKYDNGGGQSGLRENPLFKGYSSLWKSYISGLDKIFACLPNETAETMVKEEEKPKSVLEIVRAKHERVTRA